MTVLVQCVVCDETWEVRLGPVLGGPGEPDRPESVSARIAGEGGCPECGCTEATPI